MKAIIAGAVVVLMIALAIGQDTTVKAAEAVENTPDRLKEVEEQVASQFSKIRSSAHLRKVAGRQDIRARQEACRLALTNQTSEESYVTSDPKELNPTLTRISVRSDIPAGARLVTGAWFARPSRSQTGQYWIVVHVGEGAVGEWFGDHFYLTDTFEYRRDAEKKWKQSLPQQCRELKLAK